MHRRRFITLAGSSAMTAVTSPTLGQAQIINRAAVVVGVNKPGNLPVLSAAASGACEMAAWLKSEGFGVTLLTDDQSPVAAKHIKDAIREYLEPGNLQQLVVYFAGHGFVNHFSEFWMLSGAPEDADEAVNVIGSVLLAQQSGVPNIVLISDACRSAPSDLGTANVQGSIIFPNKGRAAPAGVAIDLLLATRVGEAAYEEKLSESVGKFHGLFTTSFLSAFQNPAPDMILEMGGIKVVPNRKLKKYLLSDLPARAQKRGIRLRQSPDLSVSSDDDVYIGRAKFLAQQQSQPSSKVTPEDFTTRDILGLGPPSAGGGQGELSRARDYVDARRNLLQIQDKIIPVSNSIANFVVIGSRGINQVRVSGGLEIKIIPGIDDESVNISVSGISTQAFAIGIRFADGSGTVLAGLPRYDATVFVQDDGVASVNYLTRENFDGDRLRRLRASVAAAASIGAFRLPDQDAASKFTDEIRVMKGVDPTLGLYAAYAYTQAGRSDQLVSVANIMEGDLGAPFFDVAMLAAFAGGRLPPGTGDSASRVIVPFCPMLAQGWNLLTATGAIMSKELQAAHQHMKPSLWTSFTRKGMDIVFEARDWRV